MKKTGSITINDKIININELTVRQIMSIKNGLGGGSIIDNLRELLPLVTDASEEFLMELAPSEIRALFDKIKEVNSDFFDLIPLDKLLVGYRDLMMSAIISNLSNLSVLSLPPVTEFAPLNMAGDSSLPVSQPSAKSSRNK